MHKLYEVRIYECAIAEGLFPRPERYRYTNMSQFTPDDSKGKPLKYGEGTWHFVDGKCDVYDCGAGDCAPAEIVGEINTSRSMEADRFEPTKNPLR